MTGNCHIVDKATTSISGFPEMVKGSYVIDDGNLILDYNEMTSLIETYPISKQFIKKYIGAQEFINGQTRYCLYISDTSLNTALSIPPIRQRLERCSLWRSQSKQSGTAKLAQVPHRFFYDSYERCEAAIIPVVSTSRREYIPIGLVDANTVIAASACRINNANLFILSLLQSKLHILWVSVVGGKLKNDYRYSAQLCYNTFPFPKVSEAKKQAIEEAAEEVLITRENYPGSTLADLYDPDKMPQDLREAHTRLDDIVESCYPGYPFANDEDRLECLFRLYEKMTVHPS